MSDSPLTIRLDNAGGFVSSDDGETWSLESEEVADMRRVCCDAALDSAPTRGSVWTAALRATLGEAEGVRPQGMIDILDRDDAADSGVGLMLGGIVSSKSRAFREVLDTRRSERAFEPLSLPELATVLVRAGRLRGWRDAPDGKQEETRALPSAGACHPIELEVVTTGIPGLEAGHWRFSALHCDLRKVGSHIRIDRVGASFEERGFNLRGSYTAIFAVAHFSRTLSRYPAGGSLVWRDAGIVLAGLHLCASDVELASCIVGTTGILRPVSSTAGVDLGALLLGSRPAGLD